MKTVYVTIGFLFCFCFFSNAQSVKIKIDNGKEKTVASDEKIIVESKPQKFEIKIEGNKIKYQILSGEDELRNVTGGDAFVEVDVNKLNLEEAIQVVDTDKKKPVITFTLVKEEDGGSGNKGGSTGKKNIIYPTKTIFEYINNTYTLTSSRLGLIASSKYIVNNVGQDFTHIFLDQYGNNLFSSIPQGVPERQYVVHVVYLAPVKSRELIYSVNESKSGFNPSLSIYNADIRNILTGVGETKAASNDEQSDTIIYDWVDQVILLSTSTEDIEFELYRVVVKKDPIYDFDKTKLSTFTIKMSPRYHVSMDVGLIKTNLANPTYQLVESPVSTTDKVIKVTDQGSRGVVTIMATFYTSPVILFKKFVQRQSISAYKLSGRNYLDDHTLWERIYPTIGVGFTDKTVENLFAGVNWEIVRGGALFAGWHYGKVNVFNSRPDFVFGETPITPTDFSLRLNREWRTAFCLGFKVDVKVVTSLFGTQSANQ